MAFEPRLDSFDPVASLLGSLRDIFTPKNRYMAKQIQKSLLKAQHQVTPVIDDRVGDDRSQPTISLCRAVCFSVSRLECHAGVSLNIASVSRHQHRRLPHSREWREENERWKQSKLYLVYTRLTRASDGNRALAPSHPHKATNSQNWCNGVSSTGQTRGIHAFLHAHVYVACVPCSSFEILSGLTPSFAFFPLGVTVFKIFVPVLLHCVIGSSVYILFLRQVRHFFSPFVDNVTVLFNWDKIKCTLGEHNGIARSQVSYD